MKKNKYISPDGAKRLMLAVLTQFMTDYIKAVREFKKTGKPYSKNQGGYQQFETIEIMEEWVKKMEGTFELCAHAWDKTPEELREKMLKKMSEIKGNPIRFSKKVLTRTPQNYYRLVTEVI